MTTARPWLLPFVPLYRLGRMIERLRAPEVRKLSWPVISIGNLSTGGAGKTPMAIALAKALAARDLHVDVLSRGYGRTSQSPARVNANGTAEEFGDEPLVIARDAGVPVYVAAERYQAGLMAESQYATSVLKGHDFSRADNRSQEFGALAPEGRLSSSNPISLHLLDDGFQHRRLARDADILLLSQRDMTDRLLPAGNLREPLNAFQRATVLAISADEPDVEDYLRETILTDRNSEGSRWIGPIWRIRRRMEIPPIEGPVAAFCGIARPEQFFKGLEAAGMHIASRTAFPDHHRYVQHDLDCLLDAARNVRAAVFMTTEKDRARLGKLTAKLSDTIPLKTADLRVEIENESEAIDWLISRCSPAKP